MQQHGNNKYIGWVKQFDCNTEESTIISQANVMEKDLEDWKIELSYQRDQFYELNYFTTPQLLLLREELGQLKNNPETTSLIKEDVMSLLHCLSQEITCDFVKKYVQVAISKQDFTFGTYNGM